MKEIFLPRLSWIPSASYAKIKGKNSPYNGDHLFWANRMVEYSGFSHSISKLIQRQYGRCAICQQAFLPMDIIEKDHIVPRAQGGSDRFNNLQALHKHCHVQKSRQDSVNYSPRLEDD